MIRIALFRLKQLTYFPISLSTFSALILWALFLNMLQSPPLAIAGNVIEVSQKIVDACHPDWLHFQAHINGQRIRVDLATGAIDGLRKGQTKEWFFKKIFSCREARDKFLSQLRTLARNSKCSVFSPLIEAGGAATGNLACKGSAKAAGNAAAALSKGALGLCLSAFCALDMMATPAAASEIDFYQAERCINLANQVHASRLALAMLQCQKDEILTRWRACPSDLNIQAELSAINQQIAQMVTNIHEGLNEVNNPSGDCALAPYCQEPTNPNPNQHRTVSYLESSHDEALLVDFMEIGTERIDSNLNHCRECSGTNCAIREAVDNANNELNWRTFCPRDGDIPYTHDDPPTTCSGQSCEPEESTCPNIQIDPLPNQDACNITCIPPQGSDPELVEGYLVTVANVGPYDPACDCAGANGTYFVPEDQFSSQFGTTGGSITLSTGPYCTPGGVNPITVGWNWSTDGRFFQVSACQAEGYSGCVFGFKDKDCRAECDTSVRNLEILNEPPPPPPVHPNIHCDWSQATISVQYVGNSSSQ